MVTKIVFIPWYSHHEGANVSTNVLPIMAPVDKLFENIIRVHVGKVKRF